ncbi:MAG: hypothetical protein FWH57_11250 [Oscillospiraceae bacterium]|nr:hypothetical protein [Oscillospiraceae bacterium]
MLTTRENFLRAARGQEPEYLPTYSLFWGMNGAPFHMPKPDENGVTRNLFGVESVRDQCGITDAAMPKTWDYVLTDIRKWGDVIKLPNPDDISKSEWEAAAKEARDKHDWEVPFGGGAGSPGVFQTLMGVMGFQEGLMACFEEPEYVKEFFAYIMDYTVKMAKNYAFYYKPEFTIVADDIAHERSPFVSVEVFRDIFAPCWREYYDIFRADDVICGHHNCGWFEPLLEDLVSMGVTFWDPVQSSNDSFAIKAKYGNNLVLCQGFENRFTKKGTVTEEEIKAQFREYVTKIAVGGGWAYLGRSGRRPDLPPLDTPPEESPYAAFTDNFYLDKRINEWVNEEFIEMQYTFYK